MRRADPLLELVHHEAAERGLGAHRIHRLAGISYGSAHRLLAGEGLRVSAQVQALLEALGVRLFASAPSGVALGLEPPVLLPSKPRPLPGPAPRRRRKACRPSPRGRLLLGKGEVLRLARAGLSCAEIARGAGVGAERIRQVLRLLGHRFPRRGHPQVRQSQQGAIAGSRGRI